MVKRVEFGVDCCWRKLVFDFLREEGEKEGDSVSFDRLSSTRLHFVPRVERRLC